MESLFIQIINEKSRNIIVGVIYRAPDSDVKCSFFLEGITEITEKKNKSYKKSAIFLGISTPIY